MIDIQEKTINAQREYIKTQKAHLEELREMNEATSRENARLRSITREAGVGLMLTNAYSTAVDWWFWLTD